MPRLETETPSNPTAAGPAGKGIFRRIPQGWRLFLAWLVAFYGVWLALVSYGGHWQTTLSHWPMAVAMLLGSYVAGSTPMGGGTVGFPVLVLLFDMPGALGRNFGLGIQSVGMVSASLYILGTRQTIGWRLLKPAMVGSLIATPIGVVFIAPAVADLWIKLLFAVLCASFGILQWYRMTELLASEGRLEGHPASYWPVGLTVGILGGLIASITGVGTDMLLYSAMALRYRTDLRVSIPSSVLLMAFTSVIGFSTNWLLATVDPVGFGLGPEVFPNWLAAAPIVVLGAPFGALMLRWIPRQITLRLVSILCVVQLVWMLVHERVTGATLLAVLLALFATLGMLQALYRSYRAPKKDSSESRNPSRPPAQSTRSV